MNDNYCHSCEMETYRCWSSDSGCSGGGHCIQCGGYDFEDTRRQAMEEDMQEADSVLANTLTE